MKIKGKTKEQLVKSYRRLKLTNPVKAGRILGYLRKNYASFVV